MRLNRVFFLCVSLLPLLASAQARRTVSGTIRDRSSGETLIGASVVFLETPNVSAISNSYGFYSISAIPGSYTMVVSFAGYGNDTVAVYLQKDTSISIALENAAKQLQEAVVTAGRNNNVTKPLMGVQKLSINEIKDLPVLFGEKDILKTLQLLPGVQSAGMATAGSLCGEAIRIRT